MEVIPEENILEIFLPSSKCRTDAKNIEIVEIIFLGSGGSNATPYLSCLMRDPEGCNVCANAYKNPKCRNRRLNPNVALRYRSSTDSSNSLHTIILDCGKTFYSACADKFKALKIKEIEAVFLTHGHADAILGVDDLRNWVPIQSQVQVYSDRSTFKVLSSTYPYLMDVKAATGGGEVASIQFNIMRPWDPALVQKELSAVRRRKICGLEALSSFENEASINLPSGLEILPIRVQHGWYSDGTPYYACGFIINSGQLVYLSDISHIDEALIASIKKIYLASYPNSSHGCGILVLDCLEEDGHYRSHFCWPQSFQTIKAINPEATVLVGMSHRIDYDSFQLKIDEQMGKLGEDLWSCQNNRLKHKSGRVYVGFDGMFLKLINK